MDGADVLWGRFVDGARARLCDSQVVHLLQGAVDGGGDAEGCEGVEEVGMGFEQEGRSEEDQANYFDEAGAKGCLNNIAGVDDGDRYSGSYWGLFVYYVMEEDVRIPWGFVDEKEAAKEAVCRIVHV